MRDRDLQYRGRRAAERERYLAVNALAFPDAENRRRDYENLILDRFEPGRHPPTRRAQALDIAWANRDRAFGQARTTTNGPKKHKQQPSSRAEDCNER